jgi:hypothetical protein
MKTIERLNAAKKVAHVRVTITASFHVWERAAMGVATEAFFDRQMDFC